MKLTIPMLLAMGLLTACAYIDGVKNKPNVTPIPKSEALPVTSPSVSQVSGGNAGTVQAAKVISPAR